MDFRSTPVPTTVWCRTQRERSVPARHDGNVGRASRLGEHDDSQDCTDQGKDGSDAEGRGVALVEGTIDRAGGKRNHQLSTSSNTGSANKLLLQSRMRKVQDKSMVKKNFYLWKDDGDVEDTNGETLASTLLSCNLRRHGPWDTEQHLQARNNSTTRTIISMQHKRIPKNS